MLGEDIVAPLPGREPRQPRRRSLTFAGTTSTGVPVRLNRHWIDADIRITTGFVEPHFFAGFSGGPKMVAPASPVSTTVLVLHDAARIGHPERDLGHDRGQPGPRRRPRDRPHDRRRLRRST